MDLSIEHKADWLRAGKFYAKRLKMRVITVSVED
jgi:hypothetical protein